MGEGGGYVIECSVIWFFFVFMKIVMNLFLLMEVLGIIIELLVVLILERGVVRFFFLLR